jgi:hypothetical protein
MALWGQAASHARMKNLHIPTILVTLGLVGLVAILSGQNMVGSPRVTVNNPLGVPGWVPSDVWMARYGYDPVKKIWTFQDYTVPAGHFALIRTASAGDLFDNYVQVNEGNGLVSIAAVEYAGGDFDHGIVVDEGAIIRADPFSSSDVMTITATSSPSSST